MGHLHIVRLAKAPAGLEVKLIPSTDPDGSAIVFIHGFGGSAISTWMDFEKMLPESTKCRNLDLFFVEYDALRSDLTAIAGIIRDFLDQLFENPANLLSGAIPPSIRSPSEYRYSSLLIVCHSLGAVISRRALLDATLMSKTWPSCCKLCLFAPAHRGARVQELVMETFSFLPPVKLFLAYMRYDSPLIDQLRNGSVALNALHDETVEATKNGCNQHLNAAFVLIAQYEKVVDNTRFANDPYPITIANKTHTDLCKPKNDFQEPVRHVLSCL